MSASPLRPERAATERKRASLADSVYTAIKQDILRCRLAPGQEIFEGQLAERHGVSKTPVREALGALAREGLVRVIPRRGYVVAPITLKDVQDIYHLRLLLEASAAELAAAHITAEQLARLEALSEISYVHGDWASYTSFLINNREFHLTVAVASGNARLAEIVARLLDEMERLFFLGLDMRDRGEEMVHEHHELLDALLRGDPERARAAMVEQIQNSRKMVLETLVAGKYNRGTIQLVP